MPDTPSGLRRRRRRRIVLAGLVALVVLAAAGIAAFLASGPRLDAWAKARMRAELVNALGRPVSLGEVHVSPFSSSFVANDLVVGEVPPGTGRVLEVRQVAGTIRLRSLLRNRLEIEDLVVVSPRVTFMHRGDRLEGPLPVRRRVGLETKASGALKIVLRRLSIDDGLVTLDDESAPFWCRAEGLSVLWQGDEQGNGSGSLRTARISAGSGSMVQVGNLRAEAVLQEGSLTGRLDSTWPAGSVRIEAAVTLPTPGGAPAAGDLRGSVHLEESAESAVISGLLRLDERLTGIIDVNGSFHFQGSNWRGQGRLAARDIHFGDLSAETATMEIQGTEGGFELRDIDLRTLGGRITGTAKIPTKKGAMVEVAAHADALSLHQVLLIVGLPSPLTGSASADATLSVTPGDLDSLRLHAPVRIAAVGPARGGAPSERVHPVSGEGLVTIEKKLLVVASDRLVSGGVSTSLRVEKSLGSPETRMRLVGELAAIGEGSALVEAFMARQPNREELPWDSTRLAGSGGFDAELLFRKDTTARGRVEFSFRDFAYEGIGAPVLSGTALASGDELSFVVPRAEKDGGTLSAEGHFPVGRPGGSRIMGELNDWPLDDVLVRLNAPEGATVRGSGPVAVRFERDRMTGSANLRLADAVVGDVRFTTGALEASLQDGRVDIERLFLQGPQALLTAAGSYAIDAGELSGTLDATHVDAAIASPWLKGVPLSGHASLAASLQQQNGGAVWTARLVPEDDLAFAGRPIREIRLDVSGDGVEARFEGTFGDLARFSGTVGLEAPHRGEGRIDLDTVPLAPLLALSRPDIAALIGGEMTGTVTWSGPLDDTRAITAQGRFSPIRLSVGSESFETEEAAVLRLAEGAVHVEEVALVSSTARVLVSGRYPIEETGSVDLNITGNMDLGALTVLLPELTAAGQLKASVHVTGTQAHPDLAGTFEVDRGRLRLIDFPLVADQIHLEGTIDETGIVTNDISGVLGGGTFGGSGRVDLDGGAITSFLLQGNVANAALALPEGFRGQYSGTVRFEQKLGETPVLSGSLELDRGVWRQNFELDKVSLGQRVRPPVFQVATPAKGLASTKLELRIHADDNVWCHNDLADIEGRANLVVGGTVTSPELTGRFDAFEGGEMRFSRIRYIVDHASVLFPPGPTFNPEYDITAETRIQEYEVHIHLTGNLDKVEYDLTSIPPLPQQQILAMLVTGVATPETTTAEESQVGNQTASAVGGALASVASGRLERWLGIEEIRIEPFVASSSSSSTDPTTRVTLGKRLSPRIFVRTSVSLNSPEDPIYQVDYVLTRKVRLQLERGELGSIGGGARYATRFFYPSVRRTGEAQGTIVKPTASRRIGEVRFRGDPDLDGSALQRVAHMKPGAEFSRQKMVEGADRLKKHFVKQSYLEASVRPALRQEESALVTVDYTIEKGPKVTVKIEGAGKLERKIKDALASLWKESSFGGDFSGEGEIRIRRLLQDEGYYTCLVRVVTREEGGVKNLTFHVDAGEKVDVESVQLEGVRFIPEAEVRAQILTGAGTLFLREPLKPTVLAADVFSVVNLYRSRGYLEAQARSRVTLAPDATRAVVRISVIEGQATLLRSVGFDGEQAFSAEHLRAVVKSRAGEPFFPAQVLADRESIRRKYDLAGYPEAKVEEQLVREGERVDLIFRITEGPPRRVATVAVEGNVLTRDYVVLDKVTLQPGDPISAEKMRETRQSLMKTGLFADAQLRYDPAAGGAQGQVLRVRVSEAENLILSLGGGYDTEDGPRGSVDFANVNLWGTGRYAGVSTTYGGKLARVQLVEKEPHVFGLALWGSTLTLFYENRERDTFTQRQVGTSALLTRKTSGPLTHYLRYSIALSDVFDVTNQETFRQENFKLDLGQLRLANVGYAIVRDTRNDVFAATRGTIASADLRLYDRAIGSEKRLAKLFLQGGYNRRLPWDFVWASTLRVGVAWRGDDEAIPLQERYFAGGIASVRGFEQDTLGYVRTDTVLVDKDGDGTLERDIIDTGTLEHETLTPLGGESSVIYNNEIRHKIYGSISGVAFVDIGNTYPRNTDIFSGRMRYTGGLGIRVDTPVGPLRLEYGRKFDRIPGESPGEFVLSLGQTF